MGEGIPILQTANLFSASYLVQPILHFDVWLTLNTAYAPCGETSHYLIATTLEDGSTSGTTARAAMSSMASTT